VRCALGPRDSPEAAHPSTRSTGTRSGSCARAGMTARVGAGRATHRLRHRRGRSAGRDTATPARHVVAALTGTGGVTWRPVLPWFGYTERRVAVAKAAQITAVLAEVHRVHIVCSDINASYVVSGGPVKVPDFGIAILNGAGALPRLTQITEPSARLPTCRLSSAPDSWPLMDRTCTHSAACCLSFSPGTCRFIGRSVAVPI
jgi:hypothetical protein